MTHFIAPKTTFQTPDISSQLSGLVFDLKRCATLINQFSTLTNPDKIAKCTTDGLVEQFDCTFTRIWLVSPDRTGLKLVASSGLYTHLEGSFSQVPMGAFKVGKIAEHCIPFLSNCLPQEKWVKDRQWAIEQNIQGFAGLPLMQKDLAIGVIAVFTQTPMAPEFLEVLQILSAAVANALSGATQYQALKDQASTEKRLNASELDETHRGENLSETLAQLLGTQKLSLLGTEQPLSSAASQLLIQLAKQLAKQSCHYCRLVYKTDSVTLEAMLSVNPSDTTPAETLLGTSEFAAIEQVAHQLNGQFKVETSENKTVINIRLPQHNSTTSTLSPLSTREQEVLQLLTQGLRDKEIAKQLFISDRTVKFHVKNMLTKLSVRTRSQAIYQATKQGWLS
ncbi:MAG: LuxR C-terminal-related transcriptional regulator [Cyanobacteria bacterium J06560_2]